MSKDEYQQLARKYLGLASGPVDGAARDPRDIYHPLGEFRIIDSRAVGERVANERHRRVIAYAKDTYPEMEVVYGVSNKYDLDYDTLRHKDVLWDIELSAWGRRYTKHLFMSYADYEVACRASANPPHNPNINSENYEQLAVHRFRTFMFKRHVHTPDWKGYVSYLKQAVPDFYTLLCEPVEANFSEKDRLTHTYVVGTTGSGKSELLKQLAYQYVRNDDYASLIVLDPKGDLAYQIARWMEHVPSSRLIYIYPFLNHNYTPTINPFDVRSKDEHQKRLVAQELLNAFEEILTVEGGSNFSINMRAILLPCILALLDYPNATIRDLHRFMVPETNEDLVAFGCSHRDPEVATFFEHEFGASLYKATKHAMATRLRTLLTTGTFRDLTCGPSTIDLERAMNSKQIIVFNLQKGKVGEDESKAFGKLMVALIQAFAQRRTSLPPQERPSTHCIIDEFENYTTQSIDLILKETRGMKLHLTLAQQNVGSGLPEATERTVVSLTNVKFIGRSERSERSKTAGVIGVEGDDIPTLKDGEFYVRSGTNPAFKFKASGSLLGSRNAMPKSAWDMMRKMQLDRYYRRKDIPIREAVPPSPPPSEPKPNANRSKERKPTQAPPTDDGLKPSRKLI